MRRTEVLEEMWKNRFEEAYEGWNAGQLTQAEAARIFGMCERSFRWYLARYLRECYLLAFNADFAMPAMAAGSAVVPWVGVSLEKILCEQNKRWD